MGKSCNCGINCKCAKIQDADYFNRINNISYDLMSDFTEK